jgi:Aspartyl protease
MEIRRLVLFALASFATATAATEKPPVSIPFTRSESSVLMVSGSAGTGSQYSFILDTGAGFSVLLQSLVEKLGGKRAGQITGFRETGERLDVQLYTVPELQVGPIVRKPALVGAWDGLDKMHLDGIISLDFFRKQPITLDFKRNQLIFETPASLAGRRRSGAAVPVRFDDLRGISLDLFAPFLVATHPAECDVDTGSQGSVVAKRYMELLGLNKEDSTIKKSERTTILGNKETRYHAAVPSLALDGVPASARPNMPTMFEELIYDCVIGWDFWANRSVTFGVPDKLLILSGE